MTVESSFKIFIKKIEEWDFQVFLDLYSSGYLRQKKIILFAKIYSFFGSLFFWFAIWFLLGIYSYITKDYFIFLLITGGFQQSVIIHILIKHIIVKRNRPYITLKQNGVTQEDELIKEDCSFPSGHVTFFLFFGYIFAFAFNSWTILIVFICLDIIMAICRLLLGMHFPLDVISGFAFGTLYALLFLGLTYPYWLDFYYWIGDVFKSIINFFISI